MPSFETKTIMERRLWVLLALISMAACGIEEVSKRPGTNRDDVWTGPGMNVGSTSKEVSYVTAFDYPEGYDWRMDPEKGTVKCSLVVFADGLPMLKVPVGDSFEVSSDPDMHKMIGGHLYSYYSSEGEMVMKKDGKTILRYPGNEMISGILVQEDTLYTLGYPLQGDGFVFRKNGEAVISRTAGRTFGRLQSDGGRICFAFTEPVHADGEDIERYYHYSDGHVVQTALRDDVRKVWDIISCNGEVSYIASLTGVDKPVLFCDGRMTALSLPEASKPLSFRMIPAEDSLFWEALLFMRDGSLATALWKAPGDYISFPGGMVANSCCVYGDGICCTFNSVSSHGLIYRCGDTLPMPDGYAAMGGSCAAVSNGILHVGLSSLMGEQPLIWRDGEVKPLDVCGFIASVSAG